MAKTVPERSIQMRSVIAVRATELAPKPHSLDHASAAAAPLSALTAWQALFEHARITPGQRVLIHGAAGGVGSFATQLARWRGAHVIVTASARNVEFVRKLGADEVIDYRSTPFETVVRDVDVILDRSAARLRRSPGRSCGRTGCWSLSSGSRRSGRLVAR
jgi:NADPH:quinone reductase-like Zn-dependent oxidoreductase